MNEWADLRAKTEEFINGAILIESRLLVKFLDRISDLEQQLATVVEQRDELIINRGGEDRGSKGEPMLERLKETLKYQSLVGQSEYTEMLAWAIARIEATLIKEK